MPDFASVRDGMRQALSGWAVVRVEDGRAFVLPAPDLEVLYAALDRATGGEWSLTLAVQPGSPLTVQAGLGLHGVTRQGLASGHSLHDARLLAIADALQAYGVALAGEDGHWVEYDEEEGANVHELDVSPAPQPSSPLPPPTPRDPALEKARDHIDGLVEGLSAAGLGKEAAKVLARRGYGNTLDESREVYRELNSLKR